ncbi:ABC transporter permease [uncultured Arsenicicoccus sp.]|uniref:ABC transporter permease n=1 Tax=uncultured Arsenicicoccus sp. TaxID=491339 RepID=UPI0025955AFD|nr:ABC transporter permease [uncultured Arsenicicoccus sp.]
MTTTLAPPPHSTSSAGRARHTSPRSRLGEWWAGWRVALRLARRDTRAHGGRSALVLVMIALPVALMVAALTGYATKDVHGAEAIPAQMGSAAGAVVGAQDGQYPPSTHGELIMTCNTNGPCSPPPARPLPGVTGPVTTAPVAQVHAGIARLLGARVLPVGEEQLRVTIDGRREALATLAVDARDPIVRGRADLVSGRWPQSRDEVVVTQTAVARDLPTSGTLEGRVVTYDDTGKETVTTARLTIVGVADVPGSPEAGLPDLVRLPGALVAGRPLALIDRATPITWDDVALLGRHGIGVASRAVLQDPPPTDGDRGLSSGQQDTLLAIALLAAGLLIESTLLAGPAFAVIAQRQRRTLALAAANGATRAQLRRTVLAQALVLGVLSSLVASVVGIGLGWVGVRTYLRWRPQTIVGPFDVPWWQLAVVVACAILAAVIAALLPARGLGWIDVVSALRGEVAPRRARRWVPVVGLVLAGLGGTGVFAAMALARTALSSQGGAVAGAVVVSAVVLVAGALLTVPALLVLVGRLGGAFPVPVRMATRDASRQRGRATPTVAAIMAGTILLGATTIAFASITERQRRDYVPSAPAGWLYGQVFGTDTDPAAAAAQTIPGSRAHLVRSVALPERPGAAAGSTRAVAAATPGCTLAQIAADQAQPPRCPNLGLGLPYGSANLRFLGDDGLRDLLRVTPEQRRVLDQGGLLTSQPELARAGHLTWLAADITAKPDGTSDAGPATTLGTLPVGLLTREQAWIADTGNGVDVGVLGASAITRIGATTRADRVFVQPADGTSITDAQREAFVTAVADPSMPEEITSEVIHVERGFVDTYARLRWLMVGTVALLILVATLTATALSMGEAQRDLATLAAIGSTGRLRRAIAAAQAWVLAVVGTLVGLAVGAVPGVAFARAVTSAYDESGAVMVTPTLTVPWDVLAVAAVGIPLLAALLAALVVRGNPVLTRRTT